VICVGNVGVRLGGREILTDVSIDVEASGRLAVVGRSGCGKTTLMRAMVGLITPSSGTIEVAGETSVPAIRAKVGYVVQEGGLFPHLTARDNAMLMPRHLGWSEEKMSARSKELAELVRLPSDLLDRFPLQLSGGQRQRVGLMRALALDPEVLLLDEPFGALDPVVRAELHKGLREILAQQKKTLCIVTHDMIEAARLCDRIAVLEAGRVVESGSLGDIRAKPAHAATRALFEAAEP
jgi:osmoprotectant transport system ATP-binding protein